MNVADSRGMKRINRIWSPKVLIANRTLRILAMILVILVIVVPLNSKLKLQTGQPVTETRFSQTTQPLTTNQ